MKVKAELVNPFIDAAVGVIRELTGIEARRGHLSVQAAPAPDYEVAIIFGVYGCLTGQVVYSIKADLAKRLVLAMLGDVRPEELKTLFNNTLGELGNMITGNALAKLSKAHVGDVNITTPAIVTGKKVSVALVPRSTLVLGMYTQYGPIEIGIALEDGDEAARNRADAKAGLAEDTMPGARG